MNNMFSEFIGQHVIIEREFDDPMTGKTTTVESGRVLYISDNGLAFYLAETGYDWGHWVVADKAVLIDTFEVVAEEVNALSEERTKRWRLDFLEDEEEQPCEEE